MTDNRMYADGDDEDTPAVGTSDDPVKPQDTNDLPDEIGGKIGESSHDEITGTP